MIAQAKSDQQYFISKGWLSKLENGRATPTIYALFSLGSIYRITFGELLIAFDIDLNSINDLRRMLGLTETLSAKQGMERSSQMIYDFDIRLHALQETMRLSSLNKPGQSHQR